MTDVTQPIRLKPGRTPSDVEGMVRRSSPPCGDGGVTLVEAVVAMMIVAVVASVTVALLVRTSAITTSSARRTAAGDVLTSTLEGLRGLSPTAVPDGVQTTTQTVDGVVYTVTWSSTYLSAGSGSPCTGTTTTLAYKRIDVSVTWPGMTATNRPVTGSTLKAIGIGAGNLDQTSSGSLAVLVQGADAAPQSGVTVAVADAGSPGSLLSSQITSGNGCAVFVGLAPGSYVATVSAIGYVGTANTTTVTTVAQTVSAASITRTTVPYAPARSVAVQLSDTTSYRPAGLPLRAGDSFVPETTLPTCPGTPTTACTSGLPGTVQGLYPAVHTVKVGACSETSPSQVSVDLSPTSVTVPAGTTPTVTVPVATVTVSVTTLLGAPVTGRPVTIAHVAGCSEQYSLPASAATPTALVLPYGQWTLSATVTASSTSTTSATVTVGPSSPTASVTLKVIS